MNHQKELLSPIFSINICTAAYKSQTNFENLHFKGGGMSDYFMNLIRLNRNSFCTFYETFRVLLRSFKEFSFEPLSCKSKTLH